MKLKKWISLCLALTVMAAAMFMLAEPAHAETVSGTCGDSLTWSLDTETGVLTIEGTGDMYDYSWAVPWADYRSSINQIVLPDGLTSIGSYAFANSSVQEITIPDSVTAIGQNAFMQTRLTSVTIPANVSEIGTLAFYNCFNLADISVDAGNASYTSENGVLYTKDMETLICYPTGKQDTDFAVPSGVLTIENDAFFQNNHLNTIELPEGLITIGWGAFQSCRNLTSVNIADSVTAIGPYAFAYCESLNSVLIPAGVEIIGEAAFTNCTSLSEILVDAANASYASQDGILYSKDMSLLAAYPAGKPDTVFAIPDGVTEIGSSAFSDCSNLTDITIPDSVTDIGSWAFANCTSLTEVTIPDGVTEIYGRTFGYCTNLAEVTIPASVTNIYGNAFRNCSSLTTIRFAGTQAQWDAVEKNTYWDRNTGAYTVYCVCEVEGHNWTEATCAAPAHCTVCGTSDGESLPHTWDGDICTVCGRYSYSTGLEYTLSDDGTSYIVSGIGTCQDSELIIPAAYEGLPITAIGNDAFWDCDQIISVSIPFGVTEIGGFAFTNCSNLKEVTIPDSVAYVGYNAFYYSGLTTVTIPKSVTFIGEAAFATPNLMEIIVDAENADYCSLDGVLYSKDMTLLHSYPAGKPDTAFVIPDSVTKIGSSAFMRCANLTDITIPDSVTEIGGSAFEACSGLTEITIPDSVTAIGSWTFAGCTNLTEVTIPAGVSKIYNWTFGDCINLTEVTIPASVTNIYSNAFRNCSNLTTIRFAGTQAQWDAIEKDTNWDRYTGAYTVYCVCEVEGHNWTEATCAAPAHCTVCGTTDGESLPHTWDGDICTVCGRYSYSTGLEYTLSDDGTYYIVSGIGTCQDSELIIPTAYEGLPVTAIGSDAFYNCAQITSVSIPYGVTDIGGYAFAHCSKLIEVAIPDSVAYIGYDAFCYTGLTTITIPKSVTFIGEAAFTNCTSLSEILVDAANASYASQDGILYSKDMTLLHTYPAGKPDTVFAIPDGVTKIGSSAFEACSGLTEITIPDSVTDIGYRAFYNCTSLTEVTIPASVTNIYSNAFRNCSSLTTIRFEGTQAQWDAIEKDSNWDRNTGAYTVYCVCDQEGHDWTEASCTAPACCTVCGTVDGEALPHNFENGVCTVCGAMDLIASGTCGDNLTWTLDKDGLLTISGTGDMWEYDVRSGVSPWYDYAGLIKNVSIAEGVTFITHYAFEDCVQLTTVTIPSGMYELGQFAFADCTSLERVIFCGTNGIWNPVFSGCTSLTEVYIRYELMAERAGYEWFYNTGALDYAEHVYVLSDFGGMTESFVLGFACTNAPETVVVDGISYIMYTKGEHNYSLVNHADPTCTDNGYDHFACADCGRTYETLIPANGHSRGEDYICTVCGFDYVVDCGLTLDVITLGEDGIYYTAEGYPVVIAVNSPLPWLRENTLTDYVSWNGDSLFSLTYWDQLVAASNEDGFVYLTEESLVWILDVITGNPNWGEDESYLHNYIGFQAKPAHQHSYSADVTNPACTVGGYTTYTCECGDTYQADFTDAIGHRYETVVEPATCISSEKIIRTCIRCGAGSTSMGSVLADHSYETVTTAPDCVNGGYTVYTCTVCGESYTGDETAALGHQYEAAVTAPDCVNGGYAVYTCTVCGESYTGDETAALGHQYEAAVTAPDCVNGGYAVYTCTVCGESYTGDETAALGHQYEAAVTAPDCVNGGYTVYTCSVCGETYTADETAALGHTWIDATCTEPKTCSVCQTTEGEALGHKYVDATCTAPDTCIVCGQTENEANGHYWADATCTTPKTCTVCQLTEGEPLGHTWADATCTAPKTCVVCQLTEGEVLDHTWNDATCTAPKTCSVCQATEGEALGHSYGDWVVLKEATVTETGLRQKVCANCAEAVTEVIPVVEDNPATGDQILLTCFLTSSVLCLFVLIQKKKIVK